jgi:LPXTG-motif cell wall-anchored protein
MSDGCPRDSYEIFVLVFQEVFITLGGLKSMSSTSETAVSVPGNPWWIVLVEGIFALIFGILLITAPGSTSVFLVTVLGFYWLIRGIFSIIEIFIPNTGTHWGWLLFMGILGIIAGMVVLRHPAYATIFVGTFLIIFLAVDALIMGIVGLIRAFTGAGWGPGILGVLTIIIAIFLFANVFGAALALPFIIGAFLIVGGIFAIFFSFRVRRALA